MPHRWRNQITQQGLRVVDDRKSGRHLDKLLERKRAADTARVLATIHEEEMEGLERGLWEEGTAAADEYELIHGDRAAEYWEAIPAVKAELRKCVEELTAQAEAAGTSVATAQAVFDQLSTTATVKSDYASQLETSRTYAAMPATLALALSHYL